MPAALAEHDTETLVADTNPEAIEVRLADGTTFHADFETLNRLWEDIPNHVRQAMAARTQHRRAYVDLARLGLQPVSTTRVGDPVIEWVKPGGIGAMPFGVPVLWFHADHVPRNMYRANRKPTRPERWVLSFTNKQIVLGEARWDDAAGIASLADTLLNTPLDALTVEAALLAESQGHSAEVADLSLTRELADFQDRVTPIPEITPDLCDDFLADARGRGWQHARVEPLKLLDPMLCRFVLIPGVVAVSGIPGAMPNVDAFLAKHGLMGLPTQDRHAFRYHPIVRVAVPRGHRTSVGTIPAAVCYEIASAHTDNTDVRRDQRLAVMEPITLEERATLLAP